jgi:hypothetical protein
MPTKVGIHAFSADSTPAVDADLPRHDEGGSAERFIYFRGLTA